MFYQKVYAPIDVFMSFRREQPEPMVFKWEDRFYQIQKINLVHTERLGQKKVYYFSVSDGANTYRLGFCTETLSWWLEEMCHLPPKRDVLASLRRGHLPVPAV